MKFFWTSSKEAEELVQKAIDASVEVLKRYFGDAVVSVILTGSFSRGEGIWKRVGGQIDIVSDLDLFAVLKSGKAPGDTLMGEIKKLEGKLRITIDIRTYPLAKVGFLPKDTHTFDIRATGKTLYGKNILSQLPPIVESDLGTDSIEAIFFNRALLNIENISPFDIASDAEDILSKISYEAARTIFTCTDIISIYSGTYSPFLHKRIALAKEKGDFGGRRLNSFFEDLDMAFRFVSDEHDKRLMEDASTFWIRARGHLLGLFEFVIKERYRIGDIFLYPVAAARTNRSLLERFRMFYKKVIASRWLLLKKGKIRLFWKADPPLSAKMACLMLYVAVGGEEQKYTQKALEYCASIDNSVPRGASTKETWMLLRNQLLEWHKSRIF